MITYLLGSLKELRLYTAKKPLTQNSILHLLLQENLIFLGLTSAFYYYSRSLTKCTVIVIGPEMAYRFYTVQ